MKKTHYANPLKCFGLWLMAALPLSQNAGAQCQAKFTWKQTSNNVIQFTNTSTGFTSSTFTSWQFGDNRSSRLKDPAHTYNIPGYYVVTLNIGDDSLSGPGCFSTFSDTIRVTGQKINCDTKFTWKQSHDNVIQFTNTSAAIPGQTFYWNFGDGKTSPEKSPVHTYNLPGKYMACLYMNSIDSSGSGCSISFCDTVIVTGNALGCKADFNSKQTSDNVVAFTNASLGIKSGTSFFWIFGDGDSSFVSNPVHTYKTPGNYTVCLWIREDSSGCHDYVCRNITVTGEIKCKAAFYLYKDSLQANTFHVVSKSAGTGKLRYTWNWGDQSLNDTNYYAAHTYIHPGRYNICLTITDESGCSSTACDSVLVSDAVGCKAQFTLYPHATLKNTYYTVNQSIGKGPLSYSWNWDDQSATDTSPNPVHAYAKPGTYVVCLTVKDQAGCSSMACDSVFVKQPDPCKAGFFLYPDSTTKGTYVAINKATGNGTLHYTWNWGDQSAEDTTAYPSHTYTNPGTYYICLTIRDQSGCKSTFCDTLIVPRKTQGAVTVHVKKAVTGISEHKTVYHFQAYPNPVRTTANISYSLYKAGFVQILVYNLLGNRVAELENNMQPAGTYLLAWDTSTLPQGIYLISISTGDTHPSFQRINVVK